MNTKILKLSQNMIFYSLCKSFVMYCTASRCTLVCLVDQVNSSAATRLHLTFNT